MNPLSLRHFLAPALLVLAILAPGTEARAAEGSGKSAGPTKIISYGGGGWKEGQVNEPIILINPKQPGKLVMFYSAMQLGGSGGAIGKAWADASSPLVWHEDPQNPILSRDPGIPFELSSIRLDAVIYHREHDEYWIYYTGNNAQLNYDAIGLATCPTGEDGYGGITPKNLRRHPGNPILSPKGQGRDDETFVSQGAVFREQGVWHSLYSYRTAKDVLPGLRRATSPDGVHWTKAPGPDLLTAAPEQRYLEWHQVYQIGGRYVLLFEGYNGGTRWGADVAVSGSLTNGWKKLPALLIDQTTWPNYSDAEMFHVATPALYQFNGHWHLYFQAASAGQYSIQHWALWGLNCDDLLPKILARP